MTHWHDSNPWAETAVYVPIEELADCVAGTKLAEVSGKVVDLTRERVLEHWHAAAGPDGKLDAYMLSGAGGLCAGVRFGPKPQDYLSPHILDIHRARELLAENMGSGPKP